MIKLPEKICRLEMSWKGLKKETALPNDAILFYLLNLDPNHKRLVFRPADSDGTAATLIEFKMLWNSDTAKLPKALEDKMRRFALENGCEYIFKWMDWALKDFMRSENSVRTADVNYEFLKEKGLTGMLYYMIVEVDGAKILFSAFERM